ncbi:hypothetical protein N7478_011780 [Penicillium angulare]|uniref:uncharacterized protein n=1 Tax=Penicillium angulare TaxID=116970 RepID=UPI002540A0CB|nr:uncharacterized protein N7478_011780 [Penicillium angulare]KAJ5261185.1 hypothetical protein N7478_011780 [Penicillium angulare]
MEDDGGRYCTKMAKDSPLLRPLWKDSVPRHQQTAGARKRKVVMWEDKKREKLKKNPGEEQGEQDINREESAEAQEPQKPQEVQEAQGEDKDISAPSPVVETDDDDPIPGNIERCKERIETGILPDIFERRLSKFIERQEHAEVIQELEPDLSLEIVTRLVALKEMEEYYQDVQDDYTDEELPTDPKDRWREGKRRDWTDNCLLNMQGLISAYRNGELQHHDT